MSVETVIFVIFFLVLPRTDKTSSECVIQFLPSMNGIQPRPHLESKTPESSGKSRSNFPSPCELIKSRIAKYVIEENNLLIYNDRPIGPF